MPFPTPAQRLFSREILDAGAEVGKADKQSKNSIRSKFSYEEFTNIGELTEVRSLFCRISVRSLT